MARELLTIDEIMAILPETPRRIRAVADALTPAQLAAAPEADAWSIGEILAHLRASQDVLGRSILRILAEEKPAWRRLSPRTYMRKTDYPNWEFSLALEAFTTQRAELLDVVASLAPAAWDRTAIVTEKPGETRERSARFYGDWLAGHEVVHCQQIDSTAERVGSVDDPRARGPS